MTQQAGVPRRLLGMVAMVTGAGGTNSIGASIAVRLGAEGAKVGVLDIDLTRAGLVADTIAAGRAQGKSVSVCGEMAGDVSMTKLLLGLGLRSFSMHPSQVLQVKQRILLSNASQLQTWAQDVLDSDDPAALMPR